jgi:ribonuclease BN (tRNA processing enzyme)
MTSAVLAQLLLRQPFQWFRFYIDHVTEITVERPEQVRHEPGSRIAYITDSRGDETIIDLERVAMIEVKGGRK